MTETKKDILLGKHHDITAFASSDPTRYAINSVHYNENGKAVECTDGRIMIRVPVLESESYPPVTVTAPARDCIIPLKPFQQALKNIPNGGAMPILKHMRLGVIGEGEEARVNLTTSDLDTEQNIATNPINEVYPDINQILPKDEPKLTITLSAHLLKVLAEYAAKHGTADFAPIKFEFTDGTSPVKFSVKLAADTTAIGVFCPMKGF